MIVRLLPCLLSMAALVTLTGCGTMSQASRPVSSDVAALFLANGALALDTTGTPGTIARPEAPTTSADDVVATSADIDAPPATAAAEPAAASCTDDASIVAAAAADAPALLVQDVKKKDKEKDEYDEYDVEDYDPWEKLNEKFFNFNLKLDKYVLKPVAKVWDKILPDRVQVMISNVIDNAAFVPRLMNSLFQQKWDKAVREWTRFVLNTTVGFGGMFDVAKKEGVEKSREDFGQTLGFYGADPGPYIIVPFIEPLTLRDGLGKLVDMFLDPVGYFVALFPYRAAIKATDVVNDRSLNLELYQGFEETTIDLYSAVRHAYLQRRQQLIKE